MLSLTLEVIQFWKVTKSDFKRVVAVVVVRGKEKGTSAQPVV
jgi:hypothetical protein